MKSILLVLLLCYVLSACTNVPSQKLDSDINYQKDMVITVNGVTREGMVTMPMLDKNKINVIARGDLDMFVMANCNGEWKKEKAWNVTKEIPGGLFGWGSKKIEQKREINFDYEPKGIQRDGNCALYLYGFSKEGKHSEGFIDWQTDRFQLQGTINCNGQERIFDGSEACQSRQGLYQQMTFTEDVFISPKAGCEIGKTEGKEFIFRLPPGVCTYRIKSKSSGKVGKLTTYGYNNLLIRE